MPTKCTRLLAWGGMVFGDFEHDPGDAICRIGLRERARGLGHEQALFGIERKIAQRHRQTVDQIGILLQQ